MIHNEDIWIINTINNTSMTKKFISKENINYFQLYLNASVRAFGAVSFVYVPSNSSKSCNALTLNK